MRNLVLGLAACVVFSGLAKCDVVAFYNTSARDPANPGTTQNIDFTFSANNSSPSITAFKLFGTASNAQQVSATFTIAELSSFKTVTSSTYNFAESSWLFDLTGSWSSTSVQNLAAGTYTMNISSFAVVGTGTFNYDRTTTSTISTNSGYGLTGGSYIGSSPYARFEVYTVPEPGTLLLGGIAACSGAAGAWWKRRKRKATQPESTDQPATA